MMRKGHHVLGVRTIVTSTGTSSREILRVDLTYELNLRENNDFMIDNV